MGEERHKTFTKKRALLCAALVLFAAVIGLLVANNDSTPMPVYQGKTAKQWMYEGNGSPSRQQREAFQEMGSNAVPFIVHELARKDSLWEKFCFWIYPKAPQGVRRHLSRPLPAVQRQALATECLGTVNFKTAVPALLRLQAEGDLYQKKFASALLNSLAEAKDTNAPK